MRGKKCEMSGKTSQIRVRFRRECSLPPVPPARKQVFTQPRLATHTLRVQE